MCLLKEKLQRVVPCSGTNDFTIPCVCGGPAVCQAPVSAGRAFGEGRRLQEGSLRWEHHRACRDKVREREDRTEEQDTGASQCALWSYAVQGGRARLVPCRRVGASGMSCLPHHHSLRICNKERKPHHLSTLKVASHGADDKTQTPFHRQQGPGLAPQPFAAQLSSSHTGLLLVPPNVFFCTCCFLCLGRRSPDSAHAGASSLAWPSLATVLRRWPWLCSV